MQVGSFWGRHCMENTVTVSATAVCIPISSAVLASGDQLELIQAKGKRGTRLLRWSGGHASIIPEFKADQQRLTPARIDDFPLPISLATGISDYKSPALLFTSIAEVFQSAGGLDPENAEKATFFAFATHFAECWDLAPRVIVTGVDIWETMQFLRLLACFCRHAVLTAMWEMGEHASLPSGCSPTLIISDPTNFRSRLQFLEATQHCGFDVPRAKGIGSRLFSAVILDCDNERDKIIPSTFCRINATSHIRLPLPDVKKLQKMAERFQAQLLFYRLKNLGRVKSFTFDPQTLSGGTRALGSLFGSCFPDSEELQGRVVNLLRPQDEERRLDLARCVSAVVVEALLIPCHKKQERVHVGEITDLANGILDLRGDGYRLKARKVGNILRSFSLGIRRDSLGYGFLLSTECKSRIHQLAISLDVPFLRGKIEKCEFCMQHSPNSS